MFSSPPDPRQRPAKGSPESAKALTHGLPFLAKADGSCTVEIFELLPM
jgi:hypothetical protein